MTVRHEDEHDGRGPRGRNPAGWVVGGLIAVVLVAALVNAQGPGGRDEVAPAFASRDLPTALPVGEAAQGAGATQRVAGVPVGFPQSVDGAVSAMMTYWNAAGASLFRTPQERAQVVERIFTDEGHVASGLTEEVAARTQELLGVNEAGVAEREDGSLDPARTAFALCAYEFGAYRVNSVGRAGALPFDVVVTTWAPCLSGVGGTQDVSDVDIRWSQQTSTMRWDGADWKIDDTVYLDEMAPVPADRDDVAVSFAERTRLLGKYWKLPADATEEITPAFWATGTR